MEKTIQKILSEICDKYPENIALEYGNQKLTYSELEEKTNRIASYILNQNLLQDAHIGIMTNNRMKIILSMIGILKAKKVFVIIDPEAPKNRLESIIKFSDITHVLVEDDFSEKIDDSKYEDKIEFVSYDWIVDIFHSKSSFQYNLQYSGNDKSYLFFTSGSTGEPKAVLGKNDSIVHFVEWEVNAFNIDSTYRMTQFTIATNDAFLRDVFVPLFSGATLCIPESPEIILSENKLLNWIYDNNINLIHCTPSLFYILNGDLLTLEKVRTLKYIFTVGEAIKKEKLKQWYDIIGGNVRIINLYGSTETGLAKMFHEIREIDLQKKCIPIGKELPMVRTIILDDKLQPCEIGDVGEVYIRTQYLSYGYYKNENLTKSVFIVNPFTKKENDIIYKTGDLGKVLNDYNFELIGRKDRQIKIRGNRVEISEIENTILKLYGISDCTVNFYNDAKFEEAILVAYVVSKEKIIESEIKAKLRMFIPEYMIPKYIKQIEKIPLTISGKVNYRELPNSSIFMDDEEYIPPKSKYEKKLAEIWCEILNIERVSINKSFFDVGGHSLKIMNLISKVYRVFGLELPFDIILQNISLKEMANYIESQLIDEIQAEDIAKENDKDISIKITPMQQWFISENFNHISNSNERLTMFFRDKFKIENLNNTFKYLLEKYSILNSKYNSFNNSIEINKNNHDLKIKVYDFKDKCVTREEIISLCKNEDELLDINKGPVIKVSLFSTSKGDYLSITIHEMLIDNEGWKILLKDFERIYQKYEVSKELTSINQNNVINKCCNRLINYSNSREYLRELEYWRNFEKYNITQLKIDKKLEENKNIKFKSIYLNKEETNSLLNKVNSAYSTNINEILLTSVVISMRVLVNNNRLLINIKSNNREWCNEQIDVSEVVGCFTTQYPVIIGTEQKEIGDFIKTVKDTVRNTPNKGIGYGLMKYLSNNSEKEFVDINLKAEVVFNETLKLDNMLYSDRFEIVDFNLEEKFIGEYGINLFPIIKAGRLKVVIAYNSNRYEEEIIEQLLTDIKNTLIILLNHCMKTGEAEVTLSDLVIGDINTDGLLDYINNLE
ncbi:amino acid adenylation domain-containing protein [Clostridium botulinum]|nr:amino acid adenylation domain-containing protein [Clostridium botulinum]